MQKACVWTGIKTFRHISITLTEDYKFRVEGYMDESLLVRTLTTGFKYVLKCF
jgi:hypothetical protein